jgi:hypothetical protein
MIAISWETLTEMTIHLRKTLDFGVQCTQFLDKSRWIASQSACLYITCGGLWRHMLKEQERRSQTHDGCRRKLHNSMKYVAVIAG